MSDNHTNDFKSQVIAVLRADSFEAAMHSANVALKNGIEVIEVTFTTPDAARLIDQLKKDFPNKQIGAGSISHLGDAEAAIEAGADFFVSPHFDEEVSAWFLKQKLNYIPGGLTPSELKRIQLKGHKYQKLFPAMIYNPDGVKNILAPIPSLNLVVTGGVSLDNAKEYLKAGAKVICVGGALFSKELMKEENADALASEAKKWAKL